MTANTAGERHAWASAASMAEQVQQRDREIERLHGLLAEARGPQRYAYRQTATVEEWAQHRALMLDRFHRTLDEECKANGHPLPPRGTVGEVVGLRLNSEGARDNRGELPHRIECDPEDPRATEIELRMNWTA